MLAKPLVVGLGGTLRERSYSRAALKETLRLAEAKGAETELLDLRELDLPMYVPDQPVDGYSTQHQATITRLLDACRRPTFSSGPHPPITARSAACSRTRST